jgi:hypothetical protein
MKKSSFATASVLSLFALSLQADDMAPMQQPTMEDGTVSEPEMSCAPTHLVATCKKNWVHNFEIGGDYAHVNLKPYGNPKFSGNLGGLQGLYEFRPKHNFYAAVEVAWRQGNTSGSDGNRFLRYIDTQERLGYTFGTDSEDWRLSLYSGFGFHFLGQKLTPKKGSALKLNYNEFYIPVGLKADGMFNAWFGMGFEFSWMPKVFPTVTISPLGGSHWSLKNKTNNYYVNLSFDFKLYHRFYVSVVPFYEHWEDGRSTAKTTTGLALGLPGNTYNYWGVDLNFSYRF